MSRRSMRLFFLRTWAAKAELNPKPKLPPELVARDADNVRGLVAIADSCGGEWPRRAREAMLVLFEQQQAEDPVLAILQHGLVVIDEVIGQERVKTAEFDKELRRLDLPGMDGVDIAASVVTSPSTQSRPGSGPTYCESPTSRPSQ